MRRSRQPAARAARTDVARRLCRHAGVRGARAARRCAPRHNVVGVLTQPDRPQGRGRQLTASPGEARRARARDCRSPSRRRSRVTQRARQLAQWAPDVLVVVAYGLILPRELLTPAAPGLPQYPCLAAAALARRRADPAGDPRRRRRDRRHHHADGLRSRHRSAAAAAAARPLRPGRPRARCTRRSRGSVPPRCWTCSPRSRPAPGATRAAAGRGRHVRREDREGGGPDRLDPGGVRDRAAGACLQSLARRRDEPRGRAAADPRRTSENLMPRK